MKNLFALLALLCLFVVTGCGSSNPMVGTWKLMLNEDVARVMPADQKPDVTVEFKGDNTFRVDMKMGERAQNVEGTYKLEGKTLTMHQTKEDGKPSDETETATLSDDMKSFEMPGGMGKIVKQ